MLTNRATLIIIAILVGSAILLAVFLIVLALKGKKNPKAKAGALKFFAFLFALTTSALSVIAPLVYTNTIDINLTYGIFTPTEESPYYVRLRIHRKSLEVESMGVGEYSNKEVTYKLENSNLTFDYSGKTYTFEVRSFGKHLYENGVKVFHYQKGTEG